MRIPGGAANQGSAESGSLTSSAVVVLLVLLMGATFYLWKSRYIRRKTAYFTMAVLTFLLLALAGWIYLHPMTA